MTFISESSSKYRSEIDGLRILAALSVFTFHYYPAFFPNGYVGVDVFFVLSGFLLSQTFLSGAVTGSKPSTLILIFLSFIFVGGILFLPKTLSTLDFHFLTAALPVQDFSDLWSLILADHFYFCWPILLWGLYKANRSKLSYVAFSLLLPAVLLAVLTYDLNQNLQLLPYRLWEFLAGALCAYLIPLRNHLFKHNYSGPWTNSLGALLLALTIACPLKSTAYFGIHIMIAVIATLILALSKSGFFHRILFSAKGLLVVGLLTYPLYLWHWPALTPFLAFLTYQLIERQFRQVKATWFKALVVLVALLSFLPFARLLSHHKNTLRLNADLTVSRFTFFDNLEPLPAPNGYLGLGYHFFPGQAANQVLFLGDSLADHYFPRFRYLSQNHLLKNSVEFATHFGCLPIPNSGVIGWKNKNCDLVLQSGLALANSPKVKRVIFAANWSAYSNLSDKSDFKPETLVELAKTMDSLIRAGKKVTIVLQGPKDYSFDPFTTVFCRSEILSKYFLRTKLPRQNIERKFLAINSQLRALAKASGASVFDLFEKLCESDNCPLIVDANPVFADEHGHLYQSFVINHGNFLDELDEI